MYHILDLENSPNIDKNTKINWIWKELINILKKSMNDYDLIKLTNGVFYLKKKILYICMIIT